MKHFFTAFLIFSLTGCATNVHMSPEDKQRIHRISVNRQVAMPKEMEYYGPEQAKAQAVGGIIGLAVVNQAAKENRSCIQNIMSQHHVKINEIVLDDLTQKMATQHHLNIVNNKPDAELKVAITRYGFVSKPVLFSDKYTVVLNVKAELIRNNKVVWTKSDYLSGLSYDKFPAYTIEEIRFNPSRVKEMLVAASNHLTNKILETL